MQISQNDRRIQLWKELREAIDVNSVIDALTNIDRAVNARNEQLDSFDAKRLRRQAFVSLRNLTADNPHLALALILAHLLGRCLADLPAETGDGWKTIETDGKVTKQPSDRHAALAEANELREELALWIGSYGQEDMSILRDAVLVEIINKVELLSSNRTSLIPALYTISAIGFRSPSVEKLLWEVLGQSDQAGDVAISILAGMGVPYESRSDFVRVITQRIPERPTRSLGYAIQQVATPSLLSSAIKLFDAKSNINYRSGKEKTEGLVPIPSSDLRDESDVDFSLKLTMLSHFADALWDEEQVQNAVWSAMFEASVGSEEKRARLLLGGNLAPFCNSVLVPSGLLRLGRTSSDNRAANPSEVRGSQSRADYLACLRLEESVRPAQLRGWEKVSAELVVSLKNTALLDSGHSGNDMTTPAREKTMAWRTLACAGGIWTPEDVERAVVEESSSYVRGEIMETVACFGCLPLPQIVIDILQKEYDFSVSGDERDTAGFSSCRGAENLARSTADRSAFNALLDFGFLSDGKVLRSTSDSVDEVAVWLVKNEDRSIIDQLLAIVGQVNETTSRRRIVAVSALHSLARNGLLPVEHAPKLLQVAESPNEEMEDYFRALAVEAVGFLSDPKVSASAAPRLHSLRKDADSVNVSTLAREALARHGTWRNEVEDFVSAMGLELRGGKWRVVAPQAISPHDAFTLGLMFVGEAREFDLAVCDVLDSGSDTAVFALVRLLANEDESGRRFLSTRQALILRDQLNDHQQSKRARLYVFEALALAAPTSLLEVNWAQQWRHWLPDARVALADALGMVKWHGAVDLQRATLILYGLVGDSLFAVRRAAMRALAAVNSEFLCVVCSSWLHSADLDERKRAGEASGWLPVDSVLEELKIDREKTVREAAQGSFVDRRFRGWAKDYLERVLNTSSNDVNTNYRYGRALSRIGDDEDLRLLRIRFTDGDIAPNVRFWLGEIVEELEKTWRERTQAWPEPWLQWQGIVHEANATLIQGHKSVNVRASLWHRPGEPVRGLSSWGGALWPILDQDVMAIDTGHVGLQIEGSELSRILITSSSTSGLMLFKGQGYFPQNTEV